MAKKRGGDGGELEKYIICLARRLRLYLVTEEYCLNKNYTLPKIEALRNNILSPKTPPCLANKYFFKRIHSTSKYDLA